MLEHDTALLALADTLSLALCGELKAPLEVEAPERGGRMRTLRLMPDPQDPSAFTISPWPFRVETITVEGEARPLPPTGRFADEGEMRRWLKTPARQAFACVLTPAASA